MVEESDSFMCVGGREGGTEREGGGVWKKERVAGRGVGGRGAESETERGKNGESYNYSILTVNKRRRGSGSKDGRGREIGREWVRKEKTE